MTPITVQLIKKPAIYGMILLFSRSPLVYNVLIHVWVVVVVDVKVVAVTVVDVDAVVDVEVVVVMVLVDVDADEDMVDVMLPRYFDTVGPLGLCPKCQYD